MYDFSYGRATTLLTLPFVLVHHRSVRLGSRQSSTPNDLGDEAIYVFAPSRLSTIARPPW